MKIHQLILIIIVCAYDNDVSGWKESTPQFRNKNKIKYAMALTSKHGFCTIYRQICQQTFTQ